MTDMGLEPADISTTRVAPDEGVAGQVLIYYTHFVSPAVSREVKKLADQLPADWDIWSTGCCEEATTLDKLADGRVRSKSYLRADLKTLPYPGKLATVDWKTMRGSPDLCLLRFFRDFPGYDYYWILEYDVRFTGLWGELFAELSQSTADILCTHITTYAQTPGWMHWNSFDPGEDEVPAENRLRGFLPFCRLSRRLMQAIDDSCRRGWRGHNEVLWLTVAKRHGYAIEDIGGNGPFTPPARRGRHYYSAVTNSVFLSTFAAWPFYSDRSVFLTSSKPQNTLWHPVKE